MTFTDDDVTAALNAAQPWLSAIDQDYPTRRAQMKKALAAVAPAIAARALRQAADRWDAEDKARGFLVPGEAAKRARADALEADHD